MLTAKLLFNKLIFWMSDDEEYKAFKCSQTTRMVGQRDTSLDMERQKKCIKGKFALLNQCYSHTLI